ncbi:MAG: hypothetical protein HWQ41_09340 [Nostoc sp. NOS(2021)]|uniref:hypothetical protein n=1 Tax=Nostoc sp. NOS(2021) TaxID=2815407 RepID=UPI0025FACDBA|nr:hypothetical protein [Nostoc sp. NOS(2021)]MBN3895452.1 hypothetical protein [Nostoc sp. NOS(2021)]
MDIVICSSYSKVNLGSLEKYTGKSKPYVKSAVDAACLLGMIDNQDNGYFATVKECSELLTAKPSEELKVAVFRKWLQAWKPFILFLRHLAMGDSLEVSARRLTSFYSFNKDVKAIFELLSLWSKTCNLIDAKGSLIIREYEIEIKELTDDFSRDLLDDVGVRLYLNRVLGDEVFQWLTHSELEELVTSLLTYLDNPRSAIECSGRAYEDVLRRLSVEIGTIDIKKIGAKSGISELANNVLYAYRDDSGTPYSFIHTKQRDISQAIASIRNMAGHSMEAKSMERWELSSTAAIGKILTTISSIRSLFHYIKYSKYLF